jgi:hypothetical protein
MGKVEEYLVEPFPRSLDSRRILNCYCSRLKAVTSRFVLAFDDSLLAHTVSLIMLVSETWRICCICHQYLIPRGRQYSLI